MRRCPKCVGDQPNGVLSYHLCPAAGMSVPTCTTLKRTRRPELGIAGHLGVSLCYYATTIVCLRFLAILDAGKLSAGPLAEAVRCRHAGVSLARFQTMPGAVARPCTVLFSRRVGPRPPDPESSGSS